MSVPAADAPMQYRQLGSSGLKVSVLSFGAGTFGRQSSKEQATELMKITFEAGINFFDNSEHYGKGEAEEIMGAAVKELGWKRSDAVIGTKLMFGGPGPNDVGLSRKHIVEGVRASLQRLDMEYVDLLYCHASDPKTPLEETVRAMNWCIDHGLVLYWGTSNWTAQQVTEAWEVARRLDLIGPTMEQSQYNMFERKVVESDFVPLYKSYGLGTTTFSPLAGGLLSGKYSGGAMPENTRFSLEVFKPYTAGLMTDEKLEKVDKLQPLAAELGCTLPQLAVAWAASNPDVSSVILGATKPSQLESTLQSLRYLDKITNEVKARVDDIMGNKPPAPKTYR